MEPVTRDGVAPEVDRHERDVGLRFERDVDRTVHAGGNGLHALANPPQFVEIWPQNLDRDIGASAGQHVIDAVRDGLADDDAHAGQARELRAQRGQQRLLVAALHVQARLDFGRMDLLRMRIRRRATGAARGRDHLGMREQDVLDPLAHAVRLGKLGARQRRHVDRQAALVEVGQEGTAGAHEDGRRDRQCAQGEHSDQPPAVDDGPQRGGVEARQRAQ